ncbi:hypothetical protein [Planctomycetes bacterium TBK1r]|uniref:Uncharacterized protein n=1 Tax=Stieleria magnilauensis TaxID=2527963 RepID=A0ABX5XJX4_9BACT|nr:hypothetical protein TBK1r_01800 [Planctomycetes bacterium TBK1r]
MTQPPEHDSLAKAIAWGEALQEAIDNDKPLPFSHRVAGFETDQTPAALAHWAEYANRAMATENARPSWIALFAYYLDQDSLLKNFECLHAVLRCIQRERDGSAGTMRGAHLYAAEIFGYSFANYRDHLGIGNIRYEDLMPRAAKRLCLAVKENWPLAKVAAEHDVNTDDAASLMQAAKAAIEVLEAPTPAAYFRTSITHLVQQASEKGLNTDDDITRLVTQICYRVSDLSCLLDMEDATLADYCSDFREEPDDVADSDDDFGI